MKQANGQIKLSREHEVPVIGVTPLETILLAAMHHTNSGGDVVVIDPATVRDVVIIVKPEVTKEEVVPEVKDKEGKVITSATTKTVVVSKAETRTRTTDEELDRLRSKYGVTKVKAMITEVRDIPEDFDKANARGTKIAIPSGKLSETKI